MSLKFNSKIVATLKEMKFMKFWFVFGLIWVSNHDRNNNKNINNTHK